MPWSTKDVVHHNKRAAKSSKARKVWVKVANAQLSEHGDEGRAIRIANSVADKVHASELTNYSTVNAPVDNSNPESKKMQSKPQSINTPAKDKPMTHEEILNEAVNDAEHLFTTRVNYSGKQDMENNSQNPHETNDPDKNTRMLASFDLGLQADEAPIVIAADGVSRYTTAKIARDHEKFKDVIAKHYHATDKRGRKVAPKFGWRKIFTRQNAIHEFTHPHPVAPTIKIKRKHIDGKASYVVHVKMPHLDKKGKPTGKHIFNRKVVTSSPSRVLHQMLTHARIAQSTGKQYRGPKPT
jgi:uncharacterized protein YdaT